MIPKYNFFEFTCDYYYGCSKNLLIYFLVLAYSFVAYQSEIKNLKSLILNIYLDLKYPSNLHNFRQLWY
jgi:hypothetical protein